VAATGTSFRDGVDPRPQPAVRLGLDRVSSLSIAGIERLLEARRRREAERGIERRAVAPAGHRALLADGTALLARDGRPRGLLAFDSVEDLAREARLEGQDLQALARADALRGLAGHRAQAHWEAAGIAGMPALLEPSRF